MKFTFFHFFKKIVDFFRTSDDDLFGCNVQNSYNEFYQTNYLIELASNEDTFAMNKIGKMYEKGKYFTFASIIMDIYNGE